VDRFRFGLLIRVLRQRHGWRQEDLAARADVSRSVVGRIERGDLLRIAWADLVAVAEAVGARLDLDLRWQGEGIDRLLDERHATTVDAVVGLFGRCGWEVDVEVSFSIWGERGSIDVVGRHPATGLLAIVEVKASVASGNQTVIGVDRKARLAPDIAAKRGWPCRGVAQFLVIAEGTTSRARVARHEGTFRSAFPMRGRECLAWLRSPSEPPPSGLFYIKLPNVRSTDRMRQRVRRKRASERHSSVEVRARRP
jgi:transcriptional regulator with XRE-family HTH domain